MEQCLDAIRTRKADGFLNHYTPQQSWGYHFDAFRWAVDVYYVRYVIITDLSLSCPVLADAPCQTHSVHGRERDIHKRLDLSQPSWTGESKKPRCAHLDVLQLHRNGVITLPFSGAIALRLRGPSAGRGGHARGAPPSLSLSLSVSYGGCRSSRSMISSVASTWAPPLWTMRWLSLWRMLRRCGGGRRCWTHS